MKSVFAVRGPDGLWFSWRDSDKGIDVWTESVGRACTLDNVWSAQELAVALCERNGGDYYSVYELYRPVRRLGRGF